MLELEVTQEHIQNADPDSVFQWAIALALQGECATGVSVDMTSIDFRDKTGEELEYKCSNQLAAWQNDTIKHKRCTEIIKPIVINFVDAPLYDGFSTHYNGIAEIKEYIC